MESKFQDGQYIRGRVPYMNTSSIPSVFDYIEYEFNEHSVWELFLLHISWKFMPLHWHANYANIDYIFEKKDIDKIVFIYGKLFDSTPEVTSYIDDGSLLPKITLLSDYEAEVRISYWSKWRGLVRRIIKVTKENSATKFIENSDNVEILIEYHCGIIY